MQKSLLIACCFGYLALVGCTNPKKPQISVVDGTLPFNKAMEAVIIKDEFLRRSLRPGFHRSADGVSESYTVSPDENGRVTLDHLVLLTKNWCAQNGGKVETLSELPVFQREDANLVEQSRNLPVVGNAYNMVCSKAGESLAGAAIGRNNYFLNATQFREARRRTGALME